MGGGGGGEVPKPYLEMTYIVYVKSSGSCATYNNITYIIIFVVIDTPFQGIVCNCQPVE